MVSKELEVLFASNKLVISDTVSVLEGWLKRCRAARDGHYKRAESLFNLSQFFGYLLIYSTVFVTAFSFYSNGLSEVLFFLVTKQHIVVLIGCVAAIVSAIVSQSRFGERAEMHRSSGARYANLARDIEELQLKVKVSLVNFEELSRQVTSIVKEWNNLSEDSLLTPRNPVQRKRYENFFLVVFFIMIFFFIAV